MQTLYSVQAIAMLALGVAAFAAALFCLIDAARNPAEAFTATGKLTKNWWLAITALSTLVAFVAMGNFMRGGFFVIIAVVAIGVYLADVRPALKTVAPSIRRRKNNAGGSGPYGTW